MLYKMLALLLLLVLPVAVLAQTELGVPDNMPKYKPLRVNLSEDGSHYFRIITWLQMWAKLTDNNPGTVGNDLKPDPVSFDIGIRRARFLVYAQISPRWLILTHWGINNQTFNTGGYSGGNDGKRPQLYMHDAWTEFHVVPKYLSLGMGLHYWNGVSKMANSSTLTYMMIDAPIFNWFTIETNDQFARQLGFYAKGQINRFDYRVALNQPFQNGVNPFVQNTKTTNGFNGELAAKNGYTNSLAQAGYFKYTLLDIEGNVLPYECTAHLGVRNVIHFGAGFYHHPQSTFTLEPGAGIDSLKLHATTVLGADFFYDKNVGKKGYGVSVYALYQYMDYGPNYLRNVGVMNTSMLIGNAAQLGSEYSERSVMGAGNLQPTMGTGGITYLQAGIKFPEMKNGATFMPFVAFTGKSFEAIGEFSSQYDIGFNYFIFHHHAKVTLQYSTRPVYKYETSSENGIAPNGSAGQLTLQTHIFL